MQKKNKKGFTIVELVVVIAVIGILSAILIPTFMGLSDNARKQAIQSDLSSIYTQYAVEAADGEMTLKVTENSSEIDKLYTVQILGQEEVAIEYKENAFYKFDRTENKWVALSGTGYTANSLFYTVVNSQKSYLAANSTNPKYPEFAGYRVFKATANANA